MNDLRHFYLYAKNHYVQGDIKEDLVKVYQACDYTGDWADAVTKLYHIAWEQILEYTENKEWVIREYHEHLCEVDFFGKPKNEDWLTRKARACLHVLRFTNKNEWPYELGEADTNILPRSHAGIIRDIERIGFEYDGKEQFTHTYKYPNGPMAGPSVAFIDVNWEEGTAKMYDDCAPEYCEDEVWHYKTLDDLLRGVKELAASGAFGDPNGI